MKGMKPNSSRPSVFAYFVYCFLLTGFLTACGGGGGGSSSSSTPVSVGVSGGAAKGTLANSTVTVFPLNADGSRGNTAITSTTTDANGDFSLSLDPSQFVALVVTGGSYVDEATTGTITLAPGDELEAYAQVPATGQITVNITPLTSLAAAQAREHIANDAQTLANAISNANAEVSSVFDVGNVLTTDLLSPTNLGTNPQENNYSLILAGISQLDSDDVGQTAFDIVSAISADIGADGRWGDAGSETPPDLLAAVEDFRTNAAISQTLSLSVTTIMLGQAVLDIEAAGDSTNDAPVANDDTGTVVNEGASVTIDLAANDTDVDSALDLTSIITGVATNGGLVNNNDGTVTYTHDGSETTGDSFTYTIDDTDGLTSNTATVTVTVTPVSDVPVANDDSVAVNEGAGVTINLATNDTDADDGLDLTSIITAAATNGGLVNNNDGTVTYTHDGSETTGDSFTYTIDDAGGLTSNTATVTVTVTAGNDPPVANDDSDTVNEDASVTIDLAANDTDVDSALDLTSITFSAVSNGSLVDNDDGTVTYTHDGSETTSDSFTYTISDAIGSPSNSATVTVTVTPVNDAPVANDDSDTVNEGAGITIDLAANDSDADDGLDLTSISFTSATNGSLVDNDDGTVTYTHDGSETTSDSFTYTIDDAGGVTSNSATVSVTVTPVNDAPVANDDAQTMNEGRTISIDLAGNDTDIEGAVDLTSIAIVSGPANGSIDNINADGTVDYTHNGSTTTSDSFTYTIDDLNVPAATSNTATVTLTVLQDFNEALYATPSASSSPNPLRLTQASDGITSDASNGWVADLATPQSLTLTFDSEKLIYRVALADLVTAGDVSAATLTFSNGDTPIAVPALPTGGTDYEIIFPAPKALTSITVTLDATSGAATGLSEFKVFSALEPGQSTLKADLFNDGDAAVDTRWTVVDDCTSGASSWSAATNNEYQQTGDCRGFTATEGVELGSYQVLDDGYLVKDMDLRLRLKSTDTSGSGGTWVNGAIGVLFAHRPVPGSNNDYYRLDISQAEGHIKLMKKVLGAFTELNTSPQSLTSDTWFNLRIVRQNGVIVVYKDSVKVMAVEDNEVPLNNANYRVALFCARNESCSFDNLVVLSPPSEPIVGANIVDDPGHASGEYYVDTAGSLDVTAVVTDNTDVTEVEFVVDEGQGGEISDTDSDGAPYTATFGALAEGEHTIRTYLRDASGRLSNAGALEELPKVGVSGIHLVALGDSITGGLFDDASGDDTSTDGRNTSGGYQPVLNNLLTAGNATEVTVLNEGNANETSAEGAARIDAVLIRTPAALGYLAMYGANDSGGTPTPSGLGETCANILTQVSCSGPYMGSFKQNLQLIINAASAAGKVTILGKAPPHLTSNTRDTAIQGYNLVVDELIADNASVVETLVGPTAPDFHAHFTTNAGTQMADSLHPNGLGYTRMADGWCNALNGQTLLPRLAAITCAATPLDP